MTNGQALNAYAYVYNDPVNLVDANGNIPIPPVPPVNLPNVPWRAMAVATARGGLNLLDWWNRPPEQCDCQGQSSKIVGFLGLGPQAAWAYASEPAARYGTKVVENLIGTKQVPGFWRRLPLIRSLPGKWGYKTVQVWEASPSVSGYLDELVPSGMPRGNGLHYTGPNSRYTLNTKTVPKWGWKGVGGTIALAEIIDGVFQFTSDSANPCFAWGQRFNRTAVATIFGMVAGVAGVAAFTVAVALTAPAWAVIGVSFAIGAWVGFRLSPYKEQLFATSPQYFGYQP